MQFEKFTNQLQQAFAEAQSMAIGKDHAAIEAPHLFMALLNQQGSSIRPVLNKAGFDITSLENKLSAQIDDLPKIKIPSGEVSVGNHLRRLLNLADRIAQKNDDQYISSETVLLSFIEDKKDIGPTMSKFGDLTKATDVIASVRGGEAIIDKDAESRREALNLSLIHI